jgi:hypothetical protein
MITTMRRAAISLVAAGGLLLTGVPATFAQDGPSISMMDDKGVMPSSSEPLFVGGDYMWGVDLFAPFDPVGSVDPPVEAVPVTVTWSWGDGTPDTVVSTTDTGTDFPVWCDTSSDVARCSSWAGHEYATQGLYRITATGHQDGAEDGMLEAGQAIYDLRTGGTVRASGSVWARSGGMYQQEFNGGQLFFQLNAKRRAGSSATTASLVLSVPNMVADWQGATGLTFTSSAATMPLMVKQLGRNSYELFLDRVYGQVTNSDGDAGTALAVFHAIVTKGQPTLVRFSVWNTSAGYTYVDTGTGVFPTRWTLSPIDDRLLSGSIRVG